MSVDFLDSNIFLYLFDANDARKRSIAEQVVKDAILAQSAVISPQVIAETLNVLVSKRKPPINSGQAALFLETYMLPLLSSPTWPSLYLRGLGIRFRYSFAFYDSLIVAAALELGCTRLLTEDLQHSQTIEGLRIENPFV